MKLVLVRHGESEWNLENRFTGWTDVDLSAAGVKEAEEAGRVLKKEGFDFEQRRDCGKVRGRTGPYLAAFF